MSPFKERFPWHGGDLQTLRDTFKQEAESNTPFEKLLIKIPELPDKSFAEGALLCILEKPSNQSTLKGIVILIHGLGGSTKRNGLRRMGKRLLENGFGVLKVNLRGAGEGRSHAGGTYSANCSSDLKPVIAFARSLCKQLKGESNRMLEIPLFAAGISLGGTILLNACLDNNSKSNTNPLLDGLVCTSSPLDLIECSRKIETHRNYIYQHWLLKRLIKQTLDDPFLRDSSNTTRSNDLHKFANRLRSIREFDSLVTAPRWCHKSVGEYYENESPITKIENDYISLPPTLFLQSCDDPWVPVKATQRLQQIIRDKKLTHLKVLITNKGGHNGFHGKNGCWGDYLVCNWLNSINN